MSDISKKMMAIASQLPSNFTLKGSVISLKEIFSEEGMLPGLTKRADQLAQLCLGYGLGASYEDVEDSLMGVRVVFDEFTPDALRLLCILDILYELVKMSPMPGEVPLDELMYD